MRLLNRYAKSFFYTKNFKAKNFFETFTLHMEWKQCFSILEFKNIQCFFLFWKTALIWTKAPFQKVASCSLIPPLAVWSFWYRREGEGERGWEWHVRVYVGRHKGVRNGMSCNFWRLTVTKKHLQSQMCFLF